MPEHTNAYLSKRIKEKIIERMPQDFFIDNVMFNFNLQEDLSGKTPVPRMRVIGNNGKSFALLLVPIEEVI